MVGSPLAETPGTRHTVATRCSPWYSNPLTGASWSPGEPGRGFSADLPLFAEGLNLPAQAPHFLPLLGGQAVSTAAFIAVGLPEAVPDRRRGRLALPPELLRGPARPASSTSRARSCEGYDGCVFGIVVCPLPHGEA
jgi:hypothetical protein